MVSEWLQRPGLIHRPELLLQRHVAGHVLLAAGPGERRGQAKPARARGGGISNQTRARTLAAQEPASLA
jgi:hypothetical protein